jgi:DNA-binding NarL/FixJ family response regulator
MSRYRVLVADDHPVVLERVSQILSHDYDVVATVGNGRAAVDAAVVLQPDLVVLDISMPVMSGLDAAARLSDRVRAPRIVFLTVHEDPAFAEAARSVGAAGYVLKRAMAADLLPAIRTALAGHAPYPVAHGLTG